MKHKPSIQKKQKRSHRIVSKIKPLKNVSKVALSKIAHGACFLASGGGGTLSSGLNIIKSLPKDTTVTLSSVQEAAEDKESLSAVVAYIGAPEAIENIGKPEAAINAFNKLSEFCKATFDKDINYLVPVELGALSTIVPFSVAHYVNLERKKGNLKQIKIIDGDGAGRAVPELTNLTFSQSNISVNPTVLANAPNSNTDASSSPDGYESCTLNVEGVPTAAAAIEGLARPIIGVPAFGEEAGLAMWVMHNDQLEKAIPIQKTVTLSYLVGQELAGSKSPIKSALKQINQYGRKTSILGKGKIVSVETNTAGGFDHGTVIITDTGHPDKYKNKYTVIFQNESLLLWGSNKSRPLAMAPDSICYVTSDGNPFSNGDIKSNEDGTITFPTEDVNLIGVKSDPNLLLTAKELSPKENSIFDAFQAILQNLGYAGKYVPLK